MARDGEIAWNIELSLRDRPEGLYHPWELFAVYARVSASGKAGFDVTCRFYVRAHGTSEQEVTEWSITLFNKDVTEDKRWETERTVAANYWPVVGVGTSDTDSIYLTGRLVGNNRILLAETPPLLLSWVSSPARCTGIMDGVGLMVEGVDPHGGYPCEGLLQTKLPDSHWLNQVMANDLDIGPWYATEKRPGFHAGWDPEGRALVEIRLQSAYPDLRSAWWFKFQMEIRPGCLQDKLWFRLVMHDGGKGSASIREFDGYDWNVFKPVYRWRHGEEEGTTWQRIPEAVTAESDYQCRFWVPGPGPLSDIYYLEIAQTFPYTLDDLTNLIAKCRAWDRSECRVFTAEAITFGQDENDPPPGTDYTNGAGLGEGNPIVPFLFWSGDRPDTRKEINMITCVHLEPVATWMIEGMMEDIAAHPDIYLGAASYLFVPVANPDGFKWGIVEVSPANGEDTNAWWVVGQRRSKEAWVMRSLVKTFRSAGYKFHTLLNLHNHVCPRLTRQKPPVYGLYWHKEGHIKPQELIDEMVAKLQLHGDPTVRAWDDTYDEHRRAWAEDREGYLLELLGFNMEILLEYDEIARYIHWLDEKNKEYRYEIGKHIDSIEECKEMGKELLRVFHDTQYPGAGRFDAAGGLAAPRAAASDQ